MDEIIIRPIKDDDIRSCLEIYNYYITDTTVTFEEEPLTYESFFERVNRICKTYPYFAAQVGGKTVDMLILICITSVPLTGTRQIYRYI